MKDEPANNDCADMQPRPILHTPTTANRRRNLRYVGDKTPDLSTPHRAIKNFRKVRQALFETPKRNKVLYVDNRRLHGPIETYKELISHLKKQSLISEKAAEHFMVCS